jgi:hypothetical protein
MIPTRAHGSRGGTGAPGGLADLGGLLRTPRAWSWLLVAGCGGLPPTGELEHDQPQVQIATELHGAHVFLPVHVSGSPPLWMLLDTGAELTVLDLGTARELGVGVSGFSGITGFGADTLRGGVTEGGVAIALPGAIPYHLRRPVVDLAGLEPHLGRRVPGIVGSDLFLRFTVELDYEGGRVVLHQTRHFQPRPDDVRLPLRLHRHRPYVEATLTLPDGGEIGGQFLVDTGTNTSLQLNSPFLSRHQVLERVGPTVGIMTGGVGGRTTEREGRLVALKLGPFTLDAPTVVLSTSATGAGADPAAGVIGAGILNRFTVTTDYRNRTLFLRPNGRFGKPFPSDMAGFAISVGPNDPRDFAVRWVDPGSPAERAGLAPGDRLIEIDGRPASDFSLPEIRNLFRRSEEGEISLVVGRGAETLMLRVLLVPRI